LFSFNLTLRDYFLISVIAFLFATILAIANSRETVWPSCVTTVQTLAPAASSKYTYTDSSI
jgi:hypothetical protein